MRASNLKLTAIFITSLLGMLPVCFADRLNLVYDNNGNLITGDGFYREYNSLNQLYKVYNGSDAGGNLLEEYVYHPVEERILVKRTYQDGKATKNVSYVSDDLVRVKNTSGTFDFLYVKHEGQRIAELKPGGSKMFLHPDHLGSTTLITDSNGSVFERTSYTPYGVLLSGGGVSRYGYEGKEHTEAIGSIPSENLAAYWSLESNADDLVGNNHGTVTGATATDGAVEDGYSFDGTDDSIEIGTDLIDFNKNWTISFWATNQNQHSDTSGVVTKTDSGVYGIAKGVSFTTAENPDSVFVIISDGTHNKINDTGVGANYGWTHFAAKRSADRVTIYTNGSSVATLDISTLNDVNGSQSMFFGKGNNGNYKGIIDEVGIWTRALPDNEIAELYLYRNRYRDGVQDIDFHFRRYQSEWGIFTQPDTLIPDVYDPQSLNRYMFERGNPHKYTDADGHKSLLFEGTYYVDNNEHYFGPSRVPLYSTGNPMPKKDYNQAKLLLLQDQITSPSPSTMFGFSSHPYAAITGYLADLVFFWVPRKSKYTERGQTDNGILYYNTKGYYFWVPFEQNNLKQPIKESPEQVKRGKSGGNIWVPNMTLDGRTDQEILNTAKNAGLWTGWAGWGTDGDKESSD